MHRLISAAFLTVVILSLVSRTSYAQPNGDFETWLTTPTIAPEGWATDNELNFATPVTQSRDAYSGQFAVRGDVLDNGGDPFSPVLITSSQLSPDVNDNAGFAFTGRPTGIQFALKTKNLSTDAFLIFAVLRKGQDTLAQIFDFIGGTDTTSFTVYNPKFTYFSDATPDNAIIDLELRDTTLATLAHAGSYFIVDDVTFTGLDAVPNSKLQPASAELAQNYPNPFNPSTIIHFDLAHSGMVTLKVFDITGKELRTLVDEYRPAGSYDVRFDAHDLPSGVYAYRLEAGGKSVIKQMVLEK